MMKTLREIYSSIYPKALPFTKALIVSPKSREMLAEKSIPSPSNVLFGVNIFTCSALSDDEVYTAESDEIAIAMIGLIDSCAELGINWREKFIVKTSKLAPLNEKRKVEGVYTYCKFCDSSFPDDDDLAAHEAREHLSQLDDFYLDDKEQWRLRDGK